LPTETTNTDHRTTQVQVLKQTTSELTTRMKGNHKNKIT
jgi:hypothetical protein